MDADEVEHKVRSAHEQLLRAKVEEEVVIREAISQGYSYSKVAGWLRVSEAAVRMRFKRRGWKR